MIPRRSLKTSTTSPIILSAYFSGSGNSLTEDDLLTSILWREDTGFDLSQNNHLSFDTLDHSRYKIAFNGCEIDYGLAGMIFGSGLDKQAGSVVASVARIRNIAPHRKVVVNVYGYSRGGIAGLLVAKKLGFYSPDLVEVNLALNDPVSGNLITSVKLDIFQLTLASQVLDLSACHNLKRVLCLYSCKPMPSYYFHAPVRPLYPSRTLVEEDITLGLHGNLESRKCVSFPLIAPRMIQFLMDSGTRFSRLFSRKNILLPHQFINKYQALLQKNSKLLPEKDRKLKRVFHSSTTNTHFIYERPEKYVNRHHSFFETGKSLEKSRVNIPDQVPTLDTLNNLRKLAGKVLVSLSATSRASLKGDLIRLIRHKLNHAIFYFDQNNMDEDKLQQFIIDCLRLLVRTTLQRDRNALSIFTTTDSGNALQELLMQRRYRYFANIVLGTAWHAPHYADLRRFAGTNHTSYFNASKKEDNYNRITQQLK